MTTLLRDQALAHASELYRLAYISNDHPELVKKAHQLTVDAAKAALAVAFAAPMVEAVNDYVWNTGEYSFNQLRAFIQERLETEAIETKAALDDAIVAHREAREELDQAFYANAPKVEQDRLRAMVSERVGETRKASAKAEDARWALLRYTDNRPEPKATRKRKRKPALHVARGGQ